jgi:hypothetical protein
MHHLIQLQVELKECMLDSLPTFAMVDKGVYCMLRLERDKKYAVPFQ